MRERLAEYRKLGAVFATWRATITIGRDIPSNYCIEVNAHALARYAALCQEAGLVPIIEPEALMDSDHTLERCYDVTEHTLLTFLHALYQQRVRIEHCRRLPSKRGAGRLPTSALPNGCCNTARR